MYRIHCVSRYALGENIGQGNCVQMTERSILFCRIIYSSFYLIENLSRKGAGEFRALFRAKQIRAGNRRDASLESEN